MFKFLLENFKRTNDCIILAIPFVLFMTITQCYLYSIGGFEYTPAESLFIFITLMVWFSGCCASWFYMTKKTLDFSDKIFPFDKDKKHAFLGLFKSLFKGVGKLFLPMLVVTFFLCILFIFKFVLEALIFISLPLNYILVFAIDIILYFIIFYWFMFWIPEIVYNERNPFKAILISVKNVVKSFKESLLLYTFIFIAGSLILLLLLRFIANIFCFPLLLLLLYYFIIYSVIAIFNYYRRNFVK